MTKWPESIVSFVNLQADADTPDIKYGVVIKLLSRGYLASGAKEFAQNSSLVPLRKVHRTVSLSQANSHLNEVVVDHRKGRVAARGTPRPKYRCV